MNLKEHIRKILKEEMDPLPKRTPLEKTIEDFLNISIEDFPKSDNFYGFIVDVYNDNKNCDITALFKKPFKMEDSDLLYKIMYKVKKEVLSYFGDQFYIRTGTSTIDNYNQSYERYYKVRK